MTRSLVRMHVAAVPALAFAVAVSAGARVILQPGAAYGILTVTVGGGAVLLYLAMAKALRVAELSPIMRMLLRRLAVGA